MTNPYTGHLHKQTGMRSLSYLVLHKMMGMAYNCKTKKERKNWLYVNVK